MRTVGLIVEYNPLHNGHVYHYQRSKTEARADAAVAVMSGNFLQRGEPAIVSKWARTEMALRMGADLVLELPVAYAAQPAEWFAFGAVWTLHMTGVVDCLCFGSESGSIAWLQQLAALLHDEPEPFRDEVKRQLKQGISYPSAYAEAVKQFLVQNGASYGMTDADSSAIAQPNNPLGLHYLIALNRLDSPIQPFTIQRMKAEYNQRDITDASIASATAIRRMLFEERELHRLRPYVPDFTYELLRRECDAGQAPVEWNQFIRPLLHQLLTRTPEQLSELHEVSEGLEYRLKQALPALRASAEPLEFDRLLNELKTKRYTRTKLQRTLLRILLHHSKQQLHPDRLAQGPGYIRVLGFNDTGRQLLRRMKTEASAPVILSPSGSHGLDYLELDIQAASVYTLAYRSPASEHMFRDYYDKPIYIGKTP